MNVLSLCDGMSCGRIALEEAGIKVDSYYAAEIKTAAKKVTMDNYPDTIQIGDVNNISYENGVLKTEKGEYKVNFDLVIFGSPCFVGDTLVLTLEGYKRLDEIKIGDYVLAHDNKFHRVINHMETGIKEIWEVKCRGAETLRTTDNHKFYVRKKINKSANIAPENYGAPEWVEVKNLVENYNEYRVGYAVNQNFTIPEWNGVDLPIGLGFTHKNDLDMSDPNFWYLVGRYIGDGWIKKNYKKGPRRNKYQGVIICCGKHELESFKSKIPEKYHYTITEERTVYRINFTSAEMAYFLEQFGMGAKNKYIPGFVMDLPIELLKSFLNGYLDSDGSFNGKEYSCNSVSRELIYGIEQCVAKVYHTPCTINKVKVTPTKEIEGRIVTQSSYWSLKFKTNYDTIKGSFYKDGCIWNPIRSIVNTEDYETVYDITVEDAHSFTANGVIVHNCQSFSAAMKADMRVGLEDKVRSGLFFECHRILKEVNPKYFLLENVGSMRKSDVEILTKFMGVEPVRIDAKDFGPAIRNRYYWTNIPVDKWEAHGTELQDTLDNGWTNRDRARCLLVSDSRPLTTPCKMFHRYHSSGFTTLIFKSEKHYKDCVAEYKRLKGSKDKLTAKDLDGYTGNVFDGVRYMNQNELEKCHGIPSGYTKCLTRNQAADVIGDGWSVPVIVHIFGGLK